MSGWIVATHSADHIDFSQECSYFPKQCFHLQNLHNQGPTPHHPRTCTTPFEDLHQNIQGPASEHPRPCITVSEDLHQNIQGPASDHQDLNQTIQTCIIFLEPLRQVKERGRKKINTISIISKAKLMIDEVSISEWIHSLRHPPPPQEYQVTLHDVARLHG